MRIAAAAKVTFWIAVAMRLSAADLSKERASLDRETDPARLEAAATAIAASDDPAALADLASHLGRRAFLDRLDPPSAAAPGLAHLGNVFQALAKYPSPAMAALCVKVASAPDFTAVQARLNLLLGALAQVRPVAEAAAEVFRRTARAGFLEVNGPLLATNASPFALQVLAELLADESLDAAQRASVAHWGILPNRTNPAIVSLCAGLLKGGVSRHVEMALAESLYDYQPRPWFGVEGGPSPPPWQSAPAAARVALKSLATRLLARRDIPPQLRAAIRNTQGQLNP